MASKTFLSDLRRLCGLGLPAPMFAASVAPLLRRSHGSSVTGFTRLGHDGRLEPAALSDEPPPEEVTRLYFSEPELARQLEYVIGADLWGFLHSGRIAQNSVDFPRHFSRSPLYEYVFVPQGIHHALRVALHHDGVAAGCLHLSRPPGEPPFSRHDEAFFSALAPWLAHALSVDGAGAGGQPDSVAEEGTAILDGTGHVLFRCPEADRHLRMLARPQGRENAADQARLTRLLRRLAEDCTATQAGRPAQPPSWRGDTAWGGFSLHAAPLAGESADPPRLTALRTTRRIPLAMKVATALAQRTGLSPRQKDICLALAQGLDRNRIAARLGLRPSTVITHTRELYARLGVEHREDMLRRVLESSRP